MILAMEYREWYLACIALASLDVASHWFHTYVYVFIGADGHKDLSPSSNWLLRTYYTNRIFMGFCCTCVEVFYMTAHVLKSAPDTAPTFFYYIFRIAATGFAVKQIANVSQLIAAVKTLMEIDRVGM
jgi:CDP-diacylglycerol--inositol 3-phosphatidyltransferase